MKYKRGELIFNLYRHLLKIDLPINVRARIDQYFFSFDNSLIEKMISWSSEDFINWNKENK